VSERPDLVVLLLEGTEIEPAVRRWTEGANRPSWVVLVAPADSVDPWVQPYGDLDLVITPDRIERDLAGFARTVGQAVTAPRSVLIVDPDVASARPLAEALEAGTVRTLIVPTAAEARIAVQRDRWDAVVTEWRLPDSSGQALTRWLRQLPTFRLSPILIVSAETSEDDRLAAIRAGADDAMAKTATPGTLADSIRARVYRARLARSRAHRDDLTGLLNYDSLAEELERAISAARRANESIGLLVFDVDHLRRVNEQHGHLAGDLVLTHVGRIIGATVRSSDLVARIGAEEFGVLIRRCRLEDAGRVGEKIRAAIADTPASFGDLPLRVRVSAGVASYPNHGSAAQDILRAADRALQAAKGAGRDRTVVAKQA
jgi:diguanylate cyclase (GGDEF)-like protein